MEPYELLERLVPLIPPPRAHQVRYHGVLAPCASARDRVVPGPRPPRGPAGARELKPSTGSVPGSAGMPPAGPTTPPREIDPCAAAEPMSAGRLAEFRNGANGSPARGTSRTQERDSPLDCRGRPPEPAKAPVGRAPPVRPRGDRSTRGGAQDSRVPGPARRQRAI
jgi:hypothetical protein